MKLPENFTEAMESINFLNLNPFQLMNLGCLSSGFNFHSQLVVMTLFPLILCAALFSIGFLRRSWKGMMATLILVVLYAVLPSVSTTVFAAFPCDELDTGEKFLIVDYAINCDEGSYSLFAAYAGLMIIVYPVGVPALFAWLLARKKKHIMQPVAEREEDNELAGIGFLFDNYKPSCWYFEIVVTVLRLLLTGVLGLIEPGSATQLCVGMLISFGAVVQLCLLLPYENGRDNALSVLGYVQIFLVMMCALMLKVEVFAEGVDKEMLGILLVFVNIMVLVVAVAVVVVHFLRKREEDYESDNVAAILKSEVGKQKKKGKKGEKGGEESFDDVGIELGEVFKGRESSFENANPMKENSEKAEVWETFVDHASGKEYYVNQGTGETSWEKKIGVNRSERKEKGNIGKVVAVFV